MVQVYPRINRDKEGSRGGANSYMYHLIALRTYGSNVYALSREVGGCSHLAFQSPFGPVAMYELQSVQFREPQAVQNFVTRIVECHLIHFKPCDTIHCLNPQNLFIGRNDSISTKSLLFIRKMTILKLNKNINVLPRFLNNLK